MKKFPALIILSALLLTLGIHRVEAACPATGTGSQPTTEDCNEPTTQDSNNVSFTIDNPFNGPNNLFDFLKVIIEKVLMPLGGVAVVIAFIFSGFLYVKAQGNKAEIENAHRALLYSAIGAAVLLGSWAIANVIKATIEQLI
jgi:hypothetical protein